MYCVAKLWYINWYIKCLMHKDRILWNGERTILQMYFAVVPFCWAGKAVQYVYISPSYEAKSAFSIVILDWPTPFLVLPYWDTPTLFLPALSLTLSSSLTIWPTPRCEVSDRVLGIRSRSEHVGTRWLFTLSSTSGLMFSLHVRS